MPSPYRLAEISIDKPEWGRGYALDRRPVPGDWPGSPGNYVRARGFLVPALAVTRAYAFLVGSEADVHWMEPTPMRPERDVRAWASAEVEIRRGVPTVKELHLRCPGLTGVTPDILSRTPVRELATRVAARLSLTDKPLSQYRLLRQGESDEDWWTSADRLQRPWPAPSIPRHDLEAYDRPWWGVVVDEPAALQLDKLKRPSIDEDFLERVWRAHQEAEADGRRDTTQAVCDWWEDVSGNRPGTSTARRWIAQARQLAGGEHAEDK